MFATELPGPLLMAANSYYAMSVIIASEETLFVTIKDNRYGNYTYLDPEVVLTDGRWHTFELMKEEEEGEGGERDPVWKVIIDDVTYLSCPASGCGLALDSLASAPVQVGWKTQSFLGGNPVAFTGCVKDFQFQNGMSPNLEVMVRRAEERFSTEGCPDPDVDNTSLLSFPPPTTTPTISTTSFLPLPQSPIYSPACTFPGTGPDRKRLYAAIVVFAVIVVLLAAVVCAVSIQGHRKLHPLGAKYSAQTDGLSPKTLT